VAGVNRLMGSQPSLVRSLVINNINGYGIKEKEQRLVGPESKQSVRVGQHVCTRIVVSVS
jgi:DNA-directed RNA polymerase subunit E'/Rpb7